MKNSDNSRRNFIKKGALTFAGVSLFNQFDLHAYTDSEPGNFQPNIPIDGAFALPALGFEYAALEPHVDTMTMQIHHSKHHQMYVTKLNEAIEKAPELISTE